MISRVRGTQDFLNMRLFNFVISEATRQLVCNNFTQISTPIIESVDLFKHSLGLETDVVTKQMFMLATDDNHEYLCLRPEATASTMRAFLEHAIEQKPWKVFSWGPMFRYERPQKGRYRQFHQINIEIIDTHSIYQDAWLLMLLDLLFCSTFMLETYALHINFLGCLQDRKRFKETLYTFLTSIESALCTTCQERKEKNILRVFDCKQERCQQHYENAPHITDHLCAECTTEWNVLQKTLSLLSVSYSVVPTLVRGLDYYEKTVFEFVSNQLGAQTAFCGGGRYNHLAGMLGSKQEYPSLGAAIGIERLLLLLEPLQEKLPLPAVPRLVIVIPLEQDHNALGLLIGDTLLAHDICVDVFVEESSVKSKFRKAGKLGAHTVIVIGPDEVQAGEATVKNMVTGTEEKIKQRDLVEYLKR